jgi:glyoxylase-like metal-dependent hydrolase (beta-lactamase superfamily II)
MTRALVLGGVVVVGMLSTTVGALQQLNQGAIDGAQIEQVKENLYVIKGNTPVDRALFSGGNVGVFVMERGVAIVDTKLPGWGQVLLDRIRTVTDKPIVTIVNTHTHGDHVGSNGFFPDTVNIVAHENTKANMERMDNFQGENAKYLPKQTYSERMTLGAGADQMDLYYFGAGHTNGDTFIVYPALGVLQTGDMFPWRDAPFLDTNNGGSGVALPETLAALIDGIDGIETVIPGHIPVTTWDSLVEFQGFTRDLLDAVRREKAAGSSADQAVAAVDLSGDYPDYDSTRVEAAVRVIYGELP